ncbi:hypothetical protein MMC28_002905 [Mycoblastus sanguinarius]|nr:hypothetical protein [Mycoblastus sanguinarius]
MATAGPEPPPHLLAKRKRQEEAQDSADSPSKRNRSSSNASDHEAGEKQRRVIGPAAPPAPLSELPPTRPEADGSSSDSDDDFGPSLPPAQGSSNYESEIRRQQTFFEDAPVQETAEKPGREEWMLVPPKQDDWSAHVDPTKLKTHKFNTGKGSKAPPQKSGGDSALWTETPEQKRQRLEDEVMGVKKPAQLGPENKKEGWKEQEAKETQRRIREYNEKNRGKSLYHEHKKAGPKEKEDDPSARAFDKEKDIGIGVKIGHAQKRELLNRAKDFGSRFAGGNYL